MPDLRLFVLILLCYQRAAFVAVSLNSPTQHLQCYKVLEYMNTITKTRSLTIITVCQTTCLITIIYLCHQLHACISML